jgi:hypothetical protein
LNSESVITVHYVCNNMAYVQLTGST